MVAILCPARAVWVAHWLAIVVSCRFEQWFDGHSSSSDSFEPLAWRSLFYPILLARGEGLVALWRLVSRHGIGRLAIWP